ncbi:MAG: right-handed parallel beta-helix repeat-containing protein [Opitutales bacterium]
MSASRIQTASTCRRLAPLLSAGCLLAALCASNTLSGAFFLVNLLQTTPVDLNDDDEAHIEASGAVEVTGVISAVRFPGDDRVRLINDGRIATDNGAAVTASGTRSLHLSNQGELRSNLKHAVQLSGASDARIENSGTIASGSLGAINGLGAQDIDILNTGLMRSDSHRTIAMTFSQNVHVINEGRIESATSPPIFVHEAVGFTLDNSGTLLSSGHHAVSLHRTEDLVLNNSGLIDGNGADAIYAEGVERAQIENSGTLHGRAGLGIWMVNASAASIVNTGIILGGDGGVVLGADSVLVNDGTIEGTDDGSPAIRLSGDNNRVRLGPNTQLKGDIVADAGTEGNVLEFQVGAAASYYFTTEGEFELVDLDGRPVFQGSAGAAGIGNAEIANEWLFTRSANLRHALGRRPGRFLATPRKRTSQINGPEGFWLDPAYFNVQREADPANPRITAYEQQGLALGGGVTLRRPDAAIPVDLALFLQQSETEIGGGVQTIDETTLLAGLLFPELLQLRGLDVGGYVLAGRASYDGTREVISNLPGGSLTVDADYQSRIMLSGLQARLRHAISPALAFELNTDLVLGYESIRAYEETELFSWDRRRLVQGEAGLGARAAVQLHPRTQLQAGAQFQAYTLFGGKDATVRLNGTPGTFRGGSNGDRLYRGFFQIDHRLNDRWFLGLQADFGRSDAQARTWSTGATLGLNL